MADAPYSPMEKEEVSACWKRLDGNRTEVLERSRRAAALTIPSLAPPSGHNETSRLPEPWQAVGARGVNNIASRILLTLFPPNTSNWRGYIPASLASKAGIDADALAEIDAALAQYEIEFRRSFEASGDRAHIYSSLRYYVVTGNVACRFLDDGTLRFYALAQYVVERDLDGNMLKGIVKETVDYKSLPEDVLEYVKPKDTNGQDRKKVDIYTCVERLPRGRWRECQYIDEKEVEGSDATYPTEDRMPWKFLRYSSIPGENYGRGIVDDALPDLRSLDSLTESIVQGIAVAVKTILFVKPGSVVSAKKLKDAKNGDVLSGNAEDITVLRIEKATDLKIAFDFADKLEQRLSYIFLLNSAIQRQAERVTAEEIRFMANELETALGGFYSHLAADFQVWYIRQRMRVVEKRGELPKLPKQVHVQVITGIDALGRTAELDALDRLLQGIEQTFGPEVMQHVININDYIRRRAAALGIDARTLVKKEDETAASQANANATQAATAAAPQVAQQIGQMAQVAMQPPAPQPTSQGT